MFRARATWIRLKPFQSRQFCATKNNNTSKPTTKNNNCSDNKVVESDAGNYLDPYKQLDKLDFLTAAKMLFTDPPKQKKFGIDFHLVQLFFACMPSLAVYLVAQYARYQMRKMEAELEEKKKKEEEKKAKEMELNAAEEKEISDPELLEVKERLGKLEEAVKEIAVESKKHSGSDLVKNKEDHSEKQHLAMTEPSNKSKSESSNIVENNRPNKHDSDEQGPGSAPVPDASLQDRTGKTQNGGASQDARR